MSAHENIALRAMAEFHLDGSPVFGPYLGDEAVHFTQQARALTIAISAGLQSHADKQPDDMPVSSEILAQALEGIASLLGMALLIHDQGGSAVQ